MRLISLMALLLLSCNDGSHATQPRVVIPSWANKAQVQEEIKIVPEDWRVVVTVPIFETDASPTGIARGLCSYSTKTITVGIRLHGFEPDIPYLPALQHEVGHIYNGPDYGH